MKNRQSPAHLHVHTARIVCLRKFLILGEGWSSVYKKISISRCNKLRGASAIQIYASRREGFEPWTSTTLNSIVARTRYHLECRAYPRLLNAEIVATGDVEYLRNACGYVSLREIALTTVAKSWSERDVEVAACIAPLRH
jgi:hypothetical protein